MGVVPVYSLLYDRLKAAHTKGIVAFVAKVIREQDDIE